MRSNRGGVLSVDEDETGGAAMQESLESYHSTLEVDLKRRTESYEMREVEYQEAVTELEEEFEQLMRQRKWQKHCTSCGVHCPQDSGNMHSVWQSLLPRLNSLFRSMWHTLGTLSLSLPGRPSTNCCCPLLCIRSTRLGWRRPCRSQSTDRWQPHTQSLRR